MLGGCWAVGVAWFGVVCEDAVGTVGLFAGTVDFIAESAVDGEDAIG